jgi:hypothetical protein
MRVRVEVGRLVLVGVDPAARASIQRRIERGLTNLMSDRTTLTGVVQTGRFEPKFISGLAVRQAGADRAGRTRS